MMPAAYAPPSFLGAYDKARSGMEAAVSAVATAWIPHHPVIGIIAGCAMWYGRQVALTYAPGWIADMFINCTITFIGSTSAGTFLGTTVVAPMMTPGLVPLAAAAVGFGTFYLISLIGNLAYKILSQL